MKLFGAVPGACGVLLLVACGSTAERSDGVSSPSPGQMSAAQMSGAQARALADHHISWDEYDAGFQAYRTCLHERGIELVNPHVEGDLWDFRIPGATDPDGVDAHCYQYHWEKVDDEWQLAHVDTSPSAEFLRQCLESFDVRPVEKYQDNLKLLRRAGKAIMDCPDGS